MYLTQNPTNSNALNTTTDANPQQIQNYISWLNSHLKKRPGVRLVDNLQVDMCDGVILIHLIEILSGEVFPDCNLNPKNIQEYKENVEKVLKFMQTKSIKMHQTSAKEIVEGNLKSIMRLVLALAAHFKPANVQQTQSIRNSNNFTSTSTTVTTNSTNTSTSNNNNNNNNNCNTTTTATTNHTTNNNTNTINNKQVKNESMTHLIQAACVSLSDIRRFHVKNDAAFNVTYLKQQREQQQITNEDNINMQEKQLNNNNNSSSNNNNKNETFTKNQTYNIDDSNNDLSQFIEYNTEMGKDVEEAKKLLMNLQTLLMTGNDVLNSEKKDDDSDKTFEATTADEQVAIMRSKIQQLEIICNDLRQELLMAKSESMQVNGMQSGLQTRLNDQDNTILQMKSEILQLNLTNEQLNKEKSETLHKLEEKIRVVNELKSEVNAKNAIIDKMKTEISNLNKEKEQTKYLKQQVKSFTDTLQIVKEKESTLAHLIASTDRKLGFIDTKMSHQNMKKKFVTVEEINVIKESILKLRNSFKPNHPLQYIVNTLEQGFFTIIDRVNSPINSQISSPPGAAPSIQQQTTTSNGLMKTTSNSNIPVNGQFNLTNTTPSSSSSSSSTASIKNERIPLEINTNQLQHHFSSVSSLHHNNNMNTHNSNSNINNQLKQHPSQTILISTNHTDKKNLPVITTSHQDSHNNAITKVLYYTDKSVTPFMTTIFKNINRVTLNDFKDALKLKPNNNYRFHFKTQDPEFGIVKEEITNDNTILPGYEGRVVAWIQEYE